MTDIGKNMSPMCACQLCDNTYKYFFFYKFPMVVFIIVNNLSNKINKKVNIV